MTDSEGQGTRSLQDRPARDRRGGSAAPRSGPSTGPTGSSPRPAVPPDDDAATRAAWIGSARLWAVVLVFVAVGVARSVQVDVPFRDPDGIWVRNRVFTTVMVSTALVLLDAVVRARPRTPAGVRDALRARWTWPRVALAVSALTAYHVTYWTYHNLKSWLAFLEPRDGMLQEWDLWLFNGHTPADLLHAALGEGVANYVLVGWYEVFGTVVFVAFPAAVLLARRASDALAGIAAFIWVWILGTASYYAIPSLGPFHEAPEDFEGLSRTIVQATQERFMADRAHMIAEPSAPDAFAQVAAFASLHVGVTVVVLGLAWWHRLRRTTIALAVFLAGTSVATVYVGWHFFVDDVAGLAIGLAAWWLGPRTVGARRPPAHRSTEPEPTSSP